MNRNSAYNNQRRGGRKLRWRMLTTAVICLILGVVPAVSAADGAVAEGRGGSWIGFFAPDFKDFNDRLESHGFPALEGSLMLFGGGGYGASNNVRLGGFGGGGALVTEEGSKRSEISMGFGGFQAARVWSLGKVKLDVGGMIGGGGATIVLSDGSPSSGDDAIVNQYDTVIDQGFMLLGPLVGARYEFTELVAMQVSVGYLHSVGGEWKHRNASTGLTGLPDMNGSYFSIGVVFGGYHR